MATGLAMVKEVVSGDTLVLIGQPNNGPPPEIKITLASLMAPRLGNSGKSGETKDEPFAWQAREFLRKTAIGKRVSFKVLHTATSINRSFGDVRLTQGSKENLCVVVAREGWARVKKDCDEKERSTEHNEMIALGDAAEAQGRGVFNKDPSAIESAIRNVVYENKEPQALLAKIKGTPQRALVEYCRDGGSFKVLLLDQMTYISFNLAGVQCPRLSTKVDDKDAGPEPFAREAKYFTEIRLLNRDVKVLINGLDERFNTFYGSVEHPAGDISTELIKNGLAKAVDWSMGFTSLPKAQQLRAAARDAKNGRVRIWRNYVAPKISGSKAFEGVIAEVVSGDTLMVRVGTQEQLVAQPWTCQEQRVTLSSIRAARLGARSRNEPDQAYAAEARELLRVRCLGKRCEVSIEYERAAAEGTGLPPRKFGTVIVSTRKGRKNVAALVLEEGLAEVIRHRPDEERSCQYDTLTAIQERAKEAKKGKFSQNPMKEAPERRVVDLTNNATQAKSYLSQLQMSKPGARQAGVHKANVEYCSSGSRVRLYIPGENVLANFALGGIRTPDPARNARGGKAATPAQPFAAEAGAYLRALVLQRDVSIAVESMDKGGTIIGAMNVQRGQERVDVAVCLLEAGLAYVSEFSVKYASNSEALLRAEAAAKAKRLNYWKDYVEPTPEETAAVAASATAGSASAEGKKLSSMTGVVSEIVNGAVFYVQDQSPAATAKMEAINAEMSEVATTHGTTPGTNTGIMEPKKKMDCLALFDDGSGMKWFRARIEEILPNKDGTQSAEIRYLDFGNVEVVSFDRLRPISGGVQFTVAPMAVECELAFVSVPALDKDFGVDAARALSSMVMNQKVTLKLHGKSETGRQRVSVFECDDTKSDEEQKSIGESLLSEGLGYVDEKQGRYAKGEELKIIKKLKECEDKAHQQHRGCWVYGDIRDEE